MATDMMNETSCETENDTHVCELESTKVKDEASRICNVPTWIFAIVIMMALRFHIV